jgi:polyhydroxyalkanoate synthase subunit PhaC
MNLLTALGGAPAPLVEALVPLLHGSPDVRFHVAPGGHLGVLTGRHAREVTWRQLDVFLRAYDERREEEAAPAAAA